MDQPAFPRLPGDEQQLCGYNMASGLGGIQARNKVQGYRNGCQRQANLVR